MLRRSPLLSDPCRPYFYVVLSPPTLWWHTQQWHTQQLRTCCQLRAWMRWCPLLVAFLLGWGTAPLLTQAQIYVDADASGAGNGSSWANAYPNLQDALSAATSTDQIWIATGTYYPDEGLDVTENSRGAKFHGHWQPGRAADLRRLCQWRRTFAERDPGPITKTFILSGNIGFQSERYGDDEYDNSYHVFVFNGGDRIGRNVNANVTPATVLDGVTITGGNANQDTGFQNDEGAGLYCDGRGSGNACSPTLNGLVFTDNSAREEGGAIYNDGSDGGVSSPVITNATFTGNSAGFSGGAIHNDGILGTSSPQITNAAFTGNSANRGGAISSRSIFPGTSSPVITNATFTGNSAGSDGGAIYNNGLDGGVSSPQITNVILWGNSAQTGGNEISNADATPTLRHTLIQGGLDGINESLGSSTTDGGNNRSADPRFAAAADLDGSDNRFGTADDGLRLLFGSPALDAGDNAAIGLTEDITGAARIQDDDGDGIPTVDLGAYEVDPALTLHVDAGVTGGAGNGSSWANAFSDLQDALAVATRNDQIWIAQGTYYARHGPQRQLYHVTGVQDGLQIYGGFAGTETAFSERDLGANPTILSGDIDQDGTPQR